MDKKVQEDRIAQKRAKDARRERLKSNTKILVGGFALGVVCTLIVGFSTGNFITPSNAEEMARMAANKAEIAALTPYCVAAFNKSPEVKENLAALKKTSQWSRGQYIRDNKWSDDASSMVNDACAEKIIADDVAATEAKQAAAASKGG